MATFPSIGDDTSQSETIDDAKATKDEYLGSATSSPTPTQEQGDAAITATGGQPHQGFGSHIDPGVLTPGSAFGSGAAGGGSKPTSAVTSVPGLDGPLNDEELAVWATKFGIDTSDPDWKAQVYAQLAAGSEMDPAYSKYFGVYFYLWGTNTGSEKRIQAAMDEGLNIYEFEIQERQRPAFLKTKTYQDESAEMASRLADLLGTR